MKDNNYFDLHVHATFKQYLTRFEEEFPTKRTVNDLTGKIDLNSITTFADENFLHILGSQSCIEQIEKGRLTLGVAGIAAIEKFFTEKDGIFGKALNSRFGITPLDQQYMDKVRGGLISYYQLFIKEVDLYRKLQNEKRITMLSRLKKINLNDADGIHLALSMEGCHALCRTKVGNPNQPDLMLCSSPKDTFCLDFLANPVLKPAESMKSLQQALWNEGMDLLFITLTHLSHIPEQLLATHAYGMKMLKDEAAYPDGNGITEQGKKVIDMAYNLEVTIDKNGSKKQFKAPVLVDIKHMSLKSRLDFYRYRKEKGYTMPIIASHMGVTGYSVAGWKSAIEEAYIVKDPTPAAEIIINRKKAGAWGLIHQTFTFNSWSINLMDEDIEEVINSNGLIGLILDVRVLGWQDVKEDTLSKEDKAEFLSVSEFRFLFPDLYRKITGEIKKEESFILPTKEERHPLALCFNILHIAAVGYLRTIKDPWKHICIGSDFDGLINPVINCREAGDLPELEENLLRWFPIAEKAYRKENGGPILLKRDPSGSVDMVWLKDITRGILFNNGKDFMQKWIDESLI